MLVFILTKISVIFYKPPDSIEKNFHIPTVTHLSSNKLKMLYY